VPEAVEALVTVARRFAEIRGTAWRVGELDDVTPLLADFAVPVPPADEVGGCWAPVVRPPVGWIAQNDGRVALGAAVPLGVLQATVAEYLAVIDAPMVITPWRSIIVFDLDKGVADAALRVLAPQGLVFDENSPWLSVSACTGSPGCAHSLADVRADAAEVAAATPDPAEGHRHFVGCERACGSPQAGDVLVATGDGYRLRNPHP
jgi:precorrin-3B synthase